jgi:hypothetical protein
LSGRVGVLEDCPHLQGEGEDRFQQADFSNKHTVIYPNPTHDNVIVSDILKEKGQCATISISDNFGKVIYETISCESGEIELVTKNIPAGLFFVRINSGNNQSIHKIIVQK